MTFYKVINMSYFKRVFLSLYAAIFISSLGLGILSPILPSYVDRFATSALTLGLVFGAYSASRTIFMTPIGYLSDRISRKVFIVTGLALFTTVSPLYAMANGVIHLVLVRFLQGLAAAMILPVAMSYMGDLAPKGREGFVMGTFTSAFFAGLGGGPLICGYLRDRYSMDAAFYGMGILSLAALIVVIVTLPTDEHPQHGTRKRVKARVEKRQLLPTADLAGLLIFRFSRAIGIGFTWVLMPLFAVGELHLSSFQVGVLLSVNTGITTILQAPFGHMSDRFGHLKSLFLGSVIGAFAVAGISWAGNFRDLIIVFLAMGIAGGLVVPAGSALAVRIGQERGMGTVMGLYNTSLSLGTMLGPIIGGFMADTWGIRSVFPLGGAVGIAGCLALLFLWRKTPLPHALDNGHPRY